jgi:hypothetical protein
LEVFHGKKPCEDGDLLATIQDVYGVFKSTCAGR